MPPEESAAPAAEPTMDELRAMVTGAEADPDAAPAAAAEPAAAKTEPASEPAANAGTERDANGQFKKPAAGEEPVTANVQKRIDKAVKAQRDAERRAEEAEAKLAQPGSQPAAAGKPPAAEPAPPGAAAATGKPEAKNFDSYESYVEALTDWKIGQTKATEAKAQSEAARAAADQAAGVAWNERTEAAKATHSDFDAVMAEAAELPISKAMHVTIFESEHGPEVAYFLAKHPDEAARIAKLSDFAAAREIGRIEGAITKPAAPASTPAKPAAKPLPKPAAPIGGGTAPSEVDLDKADMSTFKREMAKRLKTAA